MKRASKVWLIAGAVSVAALLMLIPLIRASSPKTEPALTVQAPSPTTEKASTAHTIELLEFLRIWMLARELELSQDQMLRFTPVFEELQRVKQQFREDRKRIMRKLRMVNQSDSSPEEQLAVLQENKALEEQYWQKVQQLTEQLNRLLTPQQRVKLALFNDTYRTKMREFIVSLRRIGEAKQ